MPRRDDLESILLIGSGPIVIGQACEFDYSGTQACRVLRDEGYRVVLVNSNPATIMTDPEFADATYVEPLDVESLDAVIEQERPDALLPTLGGQTALNLAIALHEPGVLDAVRRRADRRERRGDPHRRGPVAVQGRDEGDRSRGAAVGPRVRRRRGAGRRPEVGYPLIVRPSFILGGGGTGIAHDEDELREIAARGLAASPVGEILVEQSVVGWKEYELEVMRDHADNVVVICSIENVDPMGVHTGDSITVAPAQTLTDVEYQRMRDAAFACIRRIGVDTGGSNIQFAVDPDQRRDGHHRDEPARVAVERAREQGDRVPDREDRGEARGRLPLDEVRNDITGETPACFEPTIDYVVTKVPRWAFEKLPGRGAGARHADAVGRRGHGDRPDVPRVAAEGAAHPRDRPARPQRDPAEAELDAVPDRRARPRGGDADARAGLPASRPRCARCVASSGCTRSPASTRGSSTRSRQIVEARATLASQAPSDLSRPTGAAIKRLGFADRQLAYLWGDRARRGARGAPRAGVRASRTRPSTRARPSSRRARRTTTAPTRTRTRSRRSSARPS